MLGYLAPNRCGALGSTVGLDFNHALLYNLCMTNNEIQTQARFWTHVNVISESNSNKCWLWTGAQNGRGYGIASIGKGKTMLAHRYVAQLRENTLPKETVVRHTCDNPLCVRPDHLIVCEQKENMVDMMQKGRKQTKLNPLAVRDIRTRQLSRAEYALKYGVSQYTVVEVQLGYSWAWLP